MWFLGLNVVGVLKSKLKGYLSNLKKTVKKEPGLGYREIPTSQFNKPTKKTQTQWLIYRIQ